MKILVTSLLLLSLNAFAGSTKSGMNSALMDATYANSIATAPVSSGQSSCTSRCYMATTAVTVDTSVSTTSTTTQPASLPTNPTTAAAAPAVAAPALPAL